MQDLPPSIVSRQQLQHQDPSLPHAATAIVQFAHKAVLPNEAFLMALWHQTCPA
jgi:hypothetical protein